MIMSALNTERDAEETYSQNRVQRSEVRVTIELDLNRPLAHLK